MRLNEAIGRLRALVPLAAESARKPVAARPPVTRPPATRETNRALISEAFGYTPGGA